MNERLLAHPIYILTNFPLTREAGPEALCSENQEKVRSSSNHSVLRGQPHQVGTVNHRIVSLFVVVSTR
jgi:hypothetical protein